MTTSPAAEPLSGSPAMPMWTFADRVRKVRRDVLKLDQGPFADTLGVSRQALAAWESGRTEPRNILTVARRIEEVSGVPAAWVLGIEGGGTSRPAGDHVMRGNIGARSRGERAVIIPFPQVRDVRPDGRARAGTNGPGSSLVTTRDVAA